MALRTEQKLPVILFVVFLTLSAVGFLFYQSQASFQEAISWQKRTNDSVRSADDIARLSMALDRIYDHRFLWRTADTDQSRPDTQFSRRCIRRGRPSRISSRGQTALG